MAQYTENELEHYNEKKFIKALLTYIGVVPEQKMVTLNDHGLLIDVNNGINLTYSTPLFQDDPVEYLNEQLDRHESYIRYLDDLCSTSAHQENSTKSSTWRLIAAIRSSILDGLDGRIQKSSKTLAEMTFLKRASIDCKTFYERILLVGEDGMLGEYYDQTFARYDSLTPIQEGVDALVVLFDQIATKCDTIIDRQRERSKNLKERKRLEDISP